MPPAPGPAAACQTCHQHMCIACPETTTATVWRAVVLQALGIVAALLACMCIMMQGLPACAQPYMDLYTQATA
jgi:hypothetical protein